MIREYVIPTKCPRLNKFVNKDRNYPMTVEAIVKFDDNNSDGIIKFKGVICDCYPEGTCKAIEDSNPAAPCFYSRDFKFFPKKKINSHL